MLIDTLSEIPLIDKIDLYLDEINDILKEDLTKDDVHKYLASNRSSWGDSILNDVIKFWIDGIYSAHPGLRAFDSKTFSRKVDHFIDLESSHRELARIAVNNAHSKKWNKGECEYDGLSMLTKEANKQRRVLSPRELMEKGALSAMMKLKPCWLMSPLTISQMLPLEAGLFDLVIFDEASQVRVEDAVPSIYRAKSVVVVGDPKQMPPTNFFSAVEYIEDDDDADEDNPELTQSILDLAAQIYPPQMLEWHYRSRAESLIAFSNRAFYGGKLIAAPNPHFLTEGEAMKMHIVERAYFNQKAGNQEEAECLVSRLAELLSNDPSKSYGIITMGQSQKAAIEAAIENRIKRDNQFKAAVEKAFSYSDTDTDTDTELFVKNLENVQGDERDVILLSVGYAPSSPKKKLYMNFGPLSKLGGGRRLNVAITRAKQRIEIFCSFEPSLIQTDEAAFAKNPDMVMFGRYLKYAQAVYNKQDDTVEKVLNSFGVSGAITTRKSSGFSQVVKLRLEELGYTVSSEIGSNGFYVDLGIHHPVIPTNYMVGIECDGAIFHSLPYARDRDKLRQELLESRGWKILRVWSQDWSRDWKKEIARLDSAIKEMLD